MAFSLMAGAATANPRQRLNRNPNSYRSSLRNHSSNISRISGLFFFSTTLSAPTTFRIAAALSEGSSSRGGGEEDELTREATPSFSRSLSSARSQIDLLSQLTSTSPTTDGYDSDANSQRLTIREQLANLVGDREDDFSIQLGKKNLKKVSAAFLTISQKRNIKRQTYLTEVSQRNDSTFFATIGAFILLPPFVILGIAIATGYVQLFP